MELISLILSVTMTPFMGYVVWVLQTNRTRAINEREKADRRDQEIAKILDEATSNNEKIEHVIEKVEELSEKVETLEEHETLIREHIEQIGETLGNVADESVVSLREQLERLYYYYTAQGEITAFQLSEWKRLYKIYTNLGGNGLVSEYNTRILALPINDDLQPVRPFDIYTAPKLCKERKSNKKETDQ